MTIYLGTDHGGYQLKEIIKTWLQEQGYRVEDCGATELSPSDDYPDFAFKVAEKVVQDLDSVGILFCRSGGGMIMAANKVRRIRAIEVFDEKSAVHAKTNNNANIIAIGADWFDAEAAKKIINVFLKTEFKNETRHLRRIKKIQDYELANH